jgi:uncharacterized membrane protein YvlD (DUF360 family)
MTEPARTGWLPARIAGIWADEYDTAVNWPRGRTHLVARAVTITLVDTAALMIAGWVLPSLHVADVWSALAVTVIVGSLTFLLRPVAFLVLPQSILTTTVLTLAFLAGTLLVGVRIVPGVSIQGPPGAGVIDAVLASLVIALINMVVLAVLGLDEDESFYRRTLRKLARARGDVDDRPGPGFVILQVDGLSEPVIKSAIRTGRMPFLASWLREGTHRLRRWDARAPSMTSSGQAGILHGDSSGIPAFRWWERERDRLVVSNHPEDASRIEARISGPGDLLREGGASIANLLSGGAPRCIATTSRLVSPERGLRMDTFSLYLLNPYNVTRGAVTFGASLVTEYFQARAQRTRDVQPRISRRLPFPLLRALTTTILRDMLTDLVIGEMWRGTPIVYADYLGYDEVAHHAGPERPESMDQLEVVDRMVRSLSRAAVGAPRRYRFVILSDHGQTQGATFEQRYGATLEAFIRGLMTGDTDTLAATGDAESWGPVNAFFTELVRTPGRTARIAGRALRGKAQDGMVTLGPDARARDGAGATGDGDRARDGAGATGDGDRAHDGVPDLVVAASGNLANIYFPGTPERRDLEDVEALHPGLVRGLVEHPGIGFVLVRSTAHGALAIGRRGIRFLDDDRVAGHDPVAAFGRHAADDLRRLDTFQHVGDLLVNSLYDPSTDEIAPFEHQVGAHGGLGGPQNRAFVLYPTDLEAQHDPTSLVGGEAVNARLRAWIARARELEGVAAATGEGQLVPEVAEVIVRGEEGAAAEPEGDGGAVVEPEGDAVPPEGWPR